MSNDPVDFSNIHNFNRYAYGNNNPYKYKYKYIDPDGRQAEGASQAGLALHGSLPRSQQRTIAMVAGGIMFAPVAALLGPR